MSIDDFDFAKLIAPIDLNTFINEYWEKKPLIISRNQKKYYKDLLSVEDLDSILQYSKLKPPEIRVVKNQQDFLPDRYVKADGSLNLNQLYKAYYEDHTLVVNGLQNFWKPLAIYCQKLQNFFNHGVIANLYLSPKDSKGLSPHYDTHDVFVLQVDGSKEWQVHQCFQPVPLLGSFQPVIPENSLPKLLHTVCLQPGDLLYLPRGFVHHAATQESFSLHLTLGIYPTQWLDLMVNALTMLALKNQDLRKALPIGFLDKPEMLGEIKEQFDQLLQTFAEKSSIDEAMELINDQFIHKITPIPDGHFQQVNLVDAIAPDTLVVKREGMRCRIVKKGFSISIQFPGNSINGGLHYREAMEFVAKQKEPFTPQMLPDSLKEEQKTQLVSRLIRGGLLKTLQD
ncbi:cupin domain-containing protein [Cyanobacterium sp. Dongsha4]|uniref:cupin domain-containing protein n=1 Tax=Cyanobacterium sp. DS4 TaxID=2878255 RepID=UPI002E8094A0|nr:cupin domain-containing protein [Cyanobacterium sp. Dongsha4]WVL01354.1 cupin domain-containing protein [Cyanobacterium sp. Dongsha4]